MSIFNNKGFYPTPEKIVEQTLFNIEVKGKIILEPHGGKGDAIEVLRKYEAKEIITCELDSDLAVIAASKADRFLKNDFFKVTSDEISHVDLIWMNPPFNSADEHILHAWEIAPEGCVIIGLCNYETIKNRYSRKRVSLGSIVEKFGNYENLGNVFTDAERETGVGVALVRLFKPIKSEDKEFEGYFDLNEEYEQQGEGIIKHSELVEIVQRYVGAVKIFNSVIEKNEEINNLINPISSHLNIRFGAHRTDGRHYSGISREEFKKELQKSAWNTVFNKMKMQEYVTHKIMEKINKFVEKQENVPFTLKNIFKMIDMIVGTHSERMKEVIIEMFDWLTEHHHQNRYQKEGWKTNSEYIVNEKFIAPYIYVGVSYGGHPDISYSSTGNKMDELTKALCMITGTNYDDCVEMRKVFQTKEVENPLATEAISLLARYIGLTEKQCSYIHNGSRYVFNDPVKLEKNLLEMSYNWDLLTKEHIKKILYFYSKKDFTFSCFGKKKIVTYFGEWYDFNFLEIKVYKKGTCHARFKNKKVWEKFNKVAAEAKGFQLASKFTSDFRKKETGVEVFKQ